MKKVWRRISSGVIAAALTLSILFPVLEGVAVSAAPETASAATWNDLIGFDRLGAALLQERQDDNFEIEQGAALNKGHCRGNDNEEGDFICDNHSESLTRLKFNLKLKNPALLSFYDNSNDQVLLDWTIYKDEGAYDGESDDKEKGIRKAEPKFSVRCIMQGNTVTWCHKVIHYDEDLPFNGLMEFTVDQLATNNTERILTTDYREYVNPPTIDGYTVDTVSFYKDRPIEWDDEKTPELGFYITLGSPYSSYFVNFEYQYADYVKTKKHLFKEDELIYKNTSGWLTSDIRSVYQVLSNMDSAGALEEELTFDGEDRVACTSVLEKAREILKGEPKAVRIEYLKRIEGTPFAKKVQETITVPCYQNTIYKDDVAKELGTEALTALNSAVRAFVHDEENDIYRADYLQSVWIEARDEEGHTYHYFLDCNKSFQTYFTELKNSGAISSGLYEWILNQIEMRYPEAVSKYGYELYGYYGYTVIPNMPSFSSFSSMWSEIFGGEKLNTGNIRMWQYVGYLKSSEYNELLEEFGHSWLRRAWNDVITVGGQLEEYEATHYLFYVDDIAEDKVIFSENGSIAEGNNNGLIHNETTEIVQDAASAVGAVLEGAIGAVKNATKAKKTFGDILAVFGGIVLVAGVGVGGVFLYRKIKPVVKTAKKAKATKTKTPKAAKDKPKKKTK